MKKTKYYSMVMMAVAAAGVMVASVARAEIKMPPLFSDGMVLQCDMTVPVWGTAEPTAKVDIEFIPATGSGQRKSTTADEKGQWMVKLDAMKASAKPSELVIKSAGKPGGQGQKVVITNVLVGEVWLCSGQSNMDRALGPRPPQPEILNWKEEVAAADYPQIRQFYVGGSHAIVKDGRPDANGKWLECSPKVASRFSAVGYFFGRALHKSRKVPVGLIVSAVGGTPAELWISRKDFEAIPGIDLKSIPSIAGQHYNGKIVPVQPFGIRGVAWYQGESNNERGDKYYPLFSALIQGWRRAWGQDFPFLFVQIPPHAYVPPELREAQLVTWQKVPRTAMVVTMDCGYPENPTDWHPANKLPVGERLALAARAVAYGEKIEYSGPTYDGMKVEGAKAVLSFTHVGAGLEAKGGELKGFEVAGADGKFVAAAAQIKGSKVVVSSDKVAVPVVVRYGWTRVPDVNLFNKDGLPASPFRTDTK